MILYAYLFAHGVIYVCNNDDVPHSLEGEYFLCGGEHIDLIPAIEKVTKLHWDGVTRYVDKILTAKSRREAETLVNKVQRQLLDMDANLFLDMTDDPDKK